MKFIIVSIFSAFLFTSPICWGQDSVDGKNEINQIIEEVDDEPEITDQEESLDESIGEFVDVQWDTPQLSPRKLKFKSLKLVLVSGTTIPGTEIKVPQSSVLTYKSSGESRMFRIFKRDKALMPVKADGNGKFIVQLILPKRLVQIPFELKSPRGVVSRTIYSFKVGRTKVFPIEANQFDAILTEMRARYERRTGRKVKVKKIDSPDEKSIDTPPKDLDEATAKMAEAQGQEKIDSSEKVSSTSTYKPSKLSLSFGTGMSYVTLTEEISNVSADLDFASLNFLSFHGTLDFRIGSILIEAGGKYAPGVAEAEENSNLEVRDGEFGWFSGHGRVSYFPEALKTNFANFGVSGSFEIHSLPFLARVATNVVQMDPNDVGFIGFGGGFESDQGKAFSYSFNFQYLFPIYAGEIFEVDSSLAFGGGATFLYRFSQTWALGLNWYGQYIDLSVTSSDSGSSNRETDLSLLHSTIDLQLKFFF